MNAKRMIVALTGVAALVTAQAPVAKSAVRPPVTVYAHRGGAALAPENTLGAFRQAHSLFGARGVWIEMDTQLTADGALIVLHDDTLDRTTNCSGPVINKRLAQLASCDASEIMPSWPVFEKVPTLREVLIEGRNKGWRIFVEIKNIPMEANFDPAGTKVASALVNLIHSVNYPLARIAVQSFWPPSLTQVQLRDPRIDTALLSASTVPPLPQGVGIPATVNIAFCAVSGHEIAAPAADSIDLNAAVVTAGHLLGRKVVVYTPNTPAQITGAINKGVDGVISDRPDLVYALR